MVYAKSVDSESYAQVLAMCNVEQLKNSRIRMMPDMHASEGCTVGTSLTVTEDGINPSYVGSDIGCGMQVYCLAQESLELPRLDECIRTHVPSGAKLHERAVGALKQVPLNKLHCFGALRTDTVKRAFGTLGGGNHFIEVDRGVNGQLYLVIHSGSRRLGKDVALYYQKAAYFAAHGIDPHEGFRKRMRLSDVKSRVHPNACFLTGEYAERYLHDMDIALQYAEQSRNYMGECLIAALGLQVTDSFTTVHNYVDSKERVLRKGAVSAKLGETLIIPINMRDGSLICKGKSNPEWNCTAPHGAGRLMKRSDAKASISLEEYREAMKGIYSTSVNESTIDESPMAYRSIEDILDVIDPTVEIVDMASPIYNFKACKPAPDEDCEDGTD